MRKKERERLSDFGPDADGKVVYLGDHVRLAGGADRGRLLARLWGSYAVALLAAVVAGAANPAGLSGCPYVVMPFMLQVVALVSVAWALARLSAALRSGDRVRVYVRDETTGSLPLRSVVAGVLGLVCAAGEVVFIALGGSALAGAEVALLACEVVAACALAALWRTAAAVEWESA